ncbi:Uu.00g051470.m01.CDS01 [Anthostomella pinea]|uniref:Uu.00g051470.m01.CDS01 n=1 Tax=Anthostomella pinea TaxID=933095 RepID=A0AAI8YMS3_9PEZI|nr:Uu.00g051470.m01.CDS01 [Anthostomella pinea]
MVLEPTRPEPSPALLDDKMISEFEHLGTEHLGEGGDYSLVEIVKAAECFKRGLNAPYRTPLIREPLRAELRKYTVEQGELKDADEPTRERVYPPVILLAGTNTRRLQVPRAGVGSSGLLVGGAYAVRASIGVGIAVTSGLSAGCEAAGCHVGAASGLVSHVIAPEAVLLERVGMRQGHYEGANMVHSQFVQETCYNVVKGGPKNWLSYPHFSCKRHPGKGFTRLENLDDHAIDDDEELVETLGLGASPRVTDKRKPDGPDPRDEAKRLQNENGGLCALVTEPAVNLPSGVSPIDQHEFDAGCGRGDDASTHNGRRRYRSLQALAPSLSMISKIVAATRPMDMPSLLIGEETGCWTYFQLQVEAALLDILFILVCPVPRMAKGFFGHMKNALRRLLSYGRPDNNAKNRSRPFFKRALELTIRVKLGAANDITKLPHPQIDPAEPTAMSSLLDRHLLQGKHSQGKGRAYIQDPNEVREITRMFGEQKMTVREREAELNRVKEDLKSDRDRQERPASLMYRAARDLMSYKRLETSASD